jgi:glucose-1-phosphate thymidylyltransferase
MKGSRYMKGIILAGGFGTRLYPITKVMCKQLLPVYDKPMIYYPLSVLMLAGIRDILIISTPEDLPRIQSLFNDGSHLGLHFEYTEQSEPGGLAEAFILGKEFIGSDTVCLILGDNIFYGHSLTDLLRTSVNLKKGAIVYGHYVKDPQRYGVIEFDENQNVLSIEEKPQRPKSHYAVVGIYFYDNSVVDIARSLTPSERGELEITDVNNVYLRRGDLKVELMGRGFAWLDTGTQESLLDASAFVKTIEDRQGLKISCIEEIAYLMGYIDASQLKRLAEPLMKSGYGTYLLSIIKEP